ncbi:MAG: type II secretion system protein [Candidatus Sungbacteria bacterium]|nr:type II secretion system protein [Candidatus Sungbacteria bacterium]
MEKLRRKESKKKGLANDRFKFLGSPPSGFTIIELLTVVAIAGMLLSGALVLFQSTRAKSRDATREQHIKTLQNAFALYANNRGIYPTAASEVVLSGSDAVSLALTGENAIAQTPHDPLDQGNYQYRYRSADGTTYIIRYWLETDSVSGKSAGENTASP